MVYEWKLPDVGEGIHEAEIVQWHVGAGDTVAVDQVMCEIQTDKATVEIGAPVAGQVQKLLANEGDMVPVGTPVIIFETAQALSQSLTTASEKGTSPLPEPTQKSGAERESSGTPKRALATPAVRKLSRELGVDIQLVAATGDGGRVLADDVRSYAQGKHPSMNTHALEATSGDRANSVDAADTGKEVRIPLRGTRRSIAEHMVRSKFTAPHVTTMDEVDVSALVAMRQEMRGGADKASVKLTYLPFVMKAVVAALKRFPYLNSSLDESRQEIVLKSYYHIGIAVDDPQGLVVPVIRDADQKSLLDLAQEVQSLTAKAHEHTLTPRELGGSTFTITNFGSFGGLFATPVINYPEVGIFGTGRIQKKALVLETDEIVVRPVMSVMLTFDHRVIDGGTAGRFTNQVMQYLHRPLDLFLEMS